MKRSMRVFSLGVLTAVVSSQSWGATVDRNFNISTGNLTSSISLNGNLGISSQNGRVTLQVANIAGTPVSVGADVTIPSQNVPLSLNPNPTPINNPVTGNFVIRGEDDFKAVGPDPNDGGDYQLVPGSDGLFDDGLIKNSAMDLIVQSLNANLINQNFQTNQAIINGNVGLNILGLTTVNFGAQISGVVNGNASASFASTGPSNLIIGAQDNSTFPDGNHPFINPSNPNANASPTGVQNLGVAGIFGLPGDLSGAITAGLSGNVRVDLGIFGSINQSLGSLVNLSQPLNQAFALLGNLVAKQVPTPSLTSDDLSVLTSFDFASLGLNLSLPISFAGSQVFNVDFKVPIANLGIFGSVTFDGGFTGTVNYNLSGTAAIAPPAYSAGGSITNAVNVPEANALILLGAIGFGATALQFSRRRQAK
ncbi:hypothetical protein K2X85_03045 [bacterium]|nr:hypothetical protein [bacterium]